MLHTRVLIVLKIVLHSIPDILLRRGEPMQPSCGVSRQGVDRMSTSRKVCFLLAAAFLLPTVLAHAESRYVRREPANRQVIVFVHGVLGNSADTWTHATAKTYWPTLLTQDKEFDGANIFVVDYPSRKIGASLSIDELAESLRLALESEGVLGHSEIIFVGHSMGGLITRAFLIKYRESAAKKVKLLYFFATPTTGASIASIASLASQNSQFAKMLPMTSDAYLADVHRAWLAATELSALPSFCAYETQATFGVKIVEQQSATSLCNRRVDPVDRNHLEIVKPRGRDDAPYLAFKSAYVATAARQQHMLRMEAQGMKQIRKSVDKQPELQGQPVFCDSMRLTLLLAHSQRGNTPVRVNAISVRSEPVRDAASLKPGACAIDRLSSRPYGIVETDTFHVTSSENGVRARLIKNATTIFDVSAENLLRSATGVRAITLKPGEEPVAFEIMLETKAKSPQRIWFSADYDEDGQRTLSTTPIVVWR